MRLILSRHAKEQARERGVSIEQIKRTIQRGAKYLQGKKIVSGYTYMKVIYKKRDEDFFIITVMIKKGD